MQELDLERIAASEVVFALLLEPVMFESFGARPETPRKAFLEELRNSDIYVGIFGKKYSDATEAEYYEALKDKKDVLLYVKELLGQKRDADLEKLIKEISGLHVYRIFKSLDDLRTGLKEDLVRLLSEKYKKSVRGLEEEQAATKRLGQFLEKINYGLVKPREGGHYLSVIVAPLHSSNSLFKPSLELETILHQFPPYSMQPSFSDFDPEGYIMEAGRAHQPPLHRLKIYYNGTVHYGESLEFYKGGIVYDRVAYLLSAFVEYSLNFLSRLGYENEVWIVFSLNEVKDKPLWKPYAFWNNEYPCKENTVVIKHALKSAKVDPTSAIMEILVQFCRGYCGMKIYDKPPSWKLDDNLKSPW